MGERSSDGEQTTTSKFVDIAYRQSSIIAGSNESRSCIEKSTAESNFACGNRIKKLPIISGVTSTVSGAYDSLKKSHATFESILTATEEHLQEGAKLLDPITSSIGNALKEPLKTIDSAICEGIDYLEEKVPQLIQYSNSIIASVKSTIENLGKNDTSADESKEPPAK